MKYSNIIQITAFISISIFSVSYAWYYAGFGFDIGDEAQALLMGKYLDQLHVYSLFGWLLREGLDACGRNLVLFRKVGIIIMWSAGVVLGWAIWRFVQKDVNKTKGMVIPVVLTSASLSLLSYAKTGFTPGYNWLCHLGAVILIVTALLFAINNRTSFVSRLVIIILCSISVGIGLLLIFYGKITSFAAFFILALALAWIMTPKVARSWLLICLPGGLLIMAIASSVIGPGLLIGLAYIYDGVELISVMSPSHSLYQVLSAPFFLVVYGMYSMLKYGWIALTIIVLYSFIMIIIFKIKKKIRTVSYFNLTMGYLPILLYVFWFAVFLMARTFPSAERVEWGSSLLVLILFVWILHMSGIWRCWWRGRFNLSPVSCLRLNSFRIESLNTRASLLLFLFPAALWSGSNTSPSCFLATGAVFPVMAIFLLMIQKEAEFWPKKVIVSWIFCGVILSCLLLIHSTQKPFGVPPLTVPLKMHTELMSDWPFGNLYLEPTFAKDMKHFVSQARKAGMVESTPLINLAGKPGISLFLGARPLGSYWFVRWETGIEHYSELSLRRHSKEELEKAWLFVLNEDKVATSILKKTGLNFPNNYSWVARCRYGELWKPRLQ